MDSYLDTYYAAFDAQRVKAERDYAADVAAKQKAVRDRAEDEFRRAERKLQAAQQTLDAYWAWQASLADGEVGNGNPPHEPPVGASPRSNGNAAAPTGRKAVLTLIEDGRDGQEWSIPGIARALGLSHKAHHAIGVSLSRLARGGLIERPRKGTYTKLAPETVPSRRERNER